jgi:hypothetical protein
VGSVFTRLVQFSLLVWALGMTSTSSIAQNPRATVETAPPGKPLSTNGQAAGARSPFHGEYLYASKGYVDHTDHDRAYFEIDPGNKGQAIFVHGAVATTLDLEFKLTMLSPTQPGIWYWVFKESHSARLWAFQADRPSFYGYGIFVNESANPFSISDWKLYDYSRKSE